MDYKSLEAALYSFLAAGIGAYFGAYLKKKADQRATREDFEDIKRQLRETTGIVEEVRSGISGEIWLSQERWKLKKELYVALLQSLEEVSGLLRRLSTVTPGGEGAPDMKELRAGFERVVLDIRKSKAFASLVSDKAAAVIRELELFTTEKATNPGWRDSIDEVISKYDDMYQRLATTSRDDLLLS